VSSSLAWIDELEATSLSFDGLIATVSLVRPAAANARNQTMRNELSRIWTHLALRDDVSVVVLTGAGERFFCAGMDMKEAGAPETPGERRDRLRASRDIEQLAALPQPTIAAINGFALGGGFEMALACDVRVIAEHAEVGLTEVKHGLVPGGGGTQRLPRLIGLARAAEMLYLGLRLSGAEAVEWGVANRCVPADELPAVVKAFAVAIAEQPRRALVYAKELLRMSSSVALGPGIERELDVLLTLLADRQTPDS
jgi:enoyl-CoA hydratase/carnithine racemase